MSKHAEIAIVISDYAGQTLSTAEIVRLVQARFPDCNSQNVMPNDHAEGNRGACWCAWSDKNGRKHDAPARLFDKVSQGMFQVRAASSPTITQPKHVRVSKSSTASPSYVAEHLQFEAVRNKLHTYNSGAYAREDDLAEQPSIALAAIKIITEISAIEPGLEFIGQTCVNETGLTFPLPPTGGGVYAFRFSDLTAYIGETKKFSQRFSQYRRGADDIWTELTISQIARKLHPAQVFVMRVTASDDKGARKLRRAIEARLVRAFVGNGFRLWNAGNWRCEQAYLPYRKAAIEAQINEATLRYVGKMSETRSARLARLQAELAKTDRAMKWIER